MRIWWVNHKQTWKQEFEGGYIWSPKRKANGNKNHFYDNLCEVQPGDIILSYAYAKLQGFGIAQSYALDAPKPDDFSGFNWNQSGWRIHVDFQKYKIPLPIKDFYQFNRSLFPKRYSPINSNGGGNQGCYLAEISTTLFDEINKLTMTADDLLSVFEVEESYGQVEDVSSKLFFEEQKETWEVALVNELKSSDLCETEFRQVVKARRGQGKFRANVLKLEKQCRVTKVDQPQFLIASHIKPWRSCEDSTERLSAENGLMLTPTVDFLFDRGFISFENSGDLLFSKALNDELQKKLNIKEVNTGSYSEGQKDYLDFHRNDIFLG
jgi:putative restriction endonuclease